MKENFQNLKRGTEDLVFWWLEGHPPVVQSHAQARANICLLCPLNHDPNTFETLVGKAAVAVKKALELKHRMKLELANEHSLGVCAACGCNLELKLWTPGEVIFKDQKHPDYFEKLDSRCWIRSEAT